ncbi:AMP-binding enzyme, partial [Aerococcus urinae]
VPKEGHARDAQSIMAFAEAHLAAYKRPREIIFMDSLPRTANGKVTRRKLAQR